MVQKVLTFCKTYPTSLGIGIGLKISTSPLSITYGCITSHSKLSDLIEQWHYFHTSVSYPGCSCAGLEYILSCCWSQPTAWVGPDAPWWLHCIFRDLVLVIVWVNLSILGFFSWQWKHSMRTKMEAEAWCQKLTLRNITSAFWSQWITGLA